MARRPRRGRRLLAAAAVALACAGLAVAVPLSTGASAPGPNPYLAQGIPLVKAAKTPAGKIAPSLRSAHGPSTVFIQLSGVGAVTVSDRTLHATTGTTAHRRATARTAARARLATVRSTATAVVQAARRQDPSARELYEVGSAIPGLALRVSAAALTSLARRPDVVAITPITPQQMADASTVQLTDVVNSWDNTHEYGAGVTIGLIDSGIDFTHADFGGTGTTAAYTTAQADPTDPDWWTDLPALAQAKIVGGYDFVGDAYNASSANSDIPDPDPDPLDCNGHGTEVGSALAGYGVNSNGSTFTGDYSSLDNDDLYGMAVAPGSAPAAQLYVEKVFGCSGTTDDVIQALNWAVDRNQDGNPADHLDIVNLSVEADFTTPDDPEAEEINVLAANGVLTVAAAGNGGDQTDAGGAPGNAVQALDVASSVDSYDLHDGLDVDSPTGLVPNNVAGGQNSQAFDLDSPISGSVVTLPDGDANQSGCQTYSGTDDALVSGKIVWLPWDDDATTRPCDSATVGENAAAAGAIGVLLASTAGRFPTSITGSPAVPMFEMTMDSTQDLQQAAAAGTLSVTFDPALAHTVQDQNAQYTDTLSAFSARGVHGSVGVVKPDVTAPGDTIASAALGTGGGVTVVSGTSFAAPLVAGIAALVEEVNPGWSPAQVKAAIMNTADHNVYENPNHGQPMYGPNRVGSGRVDAAAAVDTSLLAYDTDVPGGVSASFGVIEAPITQASMTLTRTVAVQNTAETATSATVSYHSEVNQPGVSYTVSPKTLSMTQLAGGATPTVTITLHITPSALRHTIDPTEATTEGLAARQYLSDASGLLEIAPAEPAPVLRVPVYGAAKPTSSITASAGSLGGNDGIKLTGTGFNEQSSGTTGPNFYPGYTSLVSIMTLGATSPELPPCGSEPCTTNQTSTGGDIEYVGAGTDPGPDGKLTDGVAYFGIATYGDVASLGRIITPTIDIYLGTHTVPDFSVTIEDQPGTDVLYAALTDLRSGSPSEGTIVDWEPINFNYGNLDTNVFDSNVAIAPVSLAELGVSPSATTFPLSYTVTETSLYGNPADGGVIDSVGPTPYDALAPGVAVKIAAGNQPLFLDSGNTLIAANAVTAGQTALVFNLDNATGHRAQLVSMPWSKPGAPTEVVATAKVGGIGVTWSPPTSDGGSPITGYAVEYKPTTTQTWATTTVAASARSFTIPNLTSTKVYNVKVGAISGAGTTLATAAPSSLRPSADRSTATITTTASTIKFGATATITGHFTDSTSGTALSGVGVALYGKTGNGSFTRRATRTTGTGGAASVAVAPTGTTTYYWRYAGASGVHQAISSAQLKITVTQVVHVVSTRDRASRGSTVELYGTLAPNLSGQSVRIQRLTAAGWRLVRAVTTRRQRLPDGRTAVGYRAAVRISGAGPARYRVAWPATVGYRAAGVSAVCTIAVT